MSTSGLETLDWLDIALPMDDALVAGQIRGQINPLDHYGEGWDWWALDRLTAKILSGPAPVATSSIELQLLGVGGGIAALEVRGEASNTRQSFPFSPPIMVPYKYQLLFFWNTGGSPRTATLRLQSRFLRRPQPQGGYF